VLNSGDEVSIVVAEPTDLGFKVVVNNEHWGLLYKDQVFKQLRRGYQCKAYVNKLRSDGKIDLLLDKPGYGKTLDLTGQILQKLEANEGVLMLSDKSSPEAISALFGVSKKVYKQAIGALFKAGKIEITETQIKLK